jgi:probable HAF family extracellular repeat protein
MKTLATHAPPVRRITHRGTLALLALAICTTAAVGAPTTYVATPIGPFEGPPLVLLESDAFGIGPNGDVTGSSTVGADTHALVYSSGVLRDLGTLGGNYATGRAVNASGQVAGLSTLPGGGLRGFLFTGATMIELGIVGARSEARAINASGQVVGDTFLGPETNARRAFLYFDGALSLLPTLGGTQAGANGINDRGQVTGYSTRSDDLYRYAFLYSGGGVVDLGTLGGEASVGYAINANGEVTGASHFAPGNFRQHAFIYSNGQMRDIGGRGTGQSFGYGINALGTVVGAAETNGSFQNTPVQHAFVYQDGEMQDLNLLTSGLDGFVLARANAINDNGQIVASGYPAKSGLPIRGFRLDPVGKATFPSAMPAVEFYHAGLDHYFLSVDPKEIGDLDAGVHKGWVRTGKSFAVYATSATGMRPVCRFYIPPDRGDSHFFSASPDECADVLQKTQTDPAYAGYVYETPAAFYVALPDGFTGACPIGMVAVYRLWNARTDSNHRYTTDFAVRGEMIAKGYVPEGYGTGHVAMCAAS